MRNILENNDDDIDILLCNICLEVFSNDKKPIILKCGHTFCEICLKEYIKEKKCFFCGYLGKIEKNEENKENEEIKIHWENKILKNIVDYCTFLNINVDCFLSLRLDFKYCQDCDTFISNYSFNNHKLLNHNQICFNKVLKSFFEQNKIFNSNIIINDKNKYMIYFLYYYQNDFLHKLKYFDTKKNFSLRNGKYKFYGQFLSQSEQLLYINIIRENKEPFGVKLHKGILFRKNNGLIIHGYFGFKQINNNEIDLMKNIFGLLSYNNIKFFGFFNIIGNIDNILTMNNFDFKYGILYKQTYEKYYFGEFSRKNLDNNIEDIHEKYLIKGEIFTIKGEDIEIKRIGKISIIKKNPELPKQILEPSKQIPEPPKQIPEPLKQSSEIIINKSPEQSNYIVNYEFSESSNLLNIKIRYLEKYIKIIPREKFDKSNYENFYLLSNSKIYLFNYNIYFIIPLENCNSIIIFNINDESNQKNNIKEGFIFLEFDDKGKNILNKLNTFKKEDLDIPNKIFNTIDEVLNLLIGRCSIEQYDFEFEDDKIINKKKKKFEIIYKNSQDKKIRRDKKIIKIDKLIEDATIQDILPNLFIKTKNEKIICQSCMMV